MSEQDFNLNLQSFESFKLTRVLNAGKEMVSLLGSFPPQDGKEADGTSAVVLLKRRKIEENEIPALSSGETQLTLDVQNTCYGFYKAVNLTLPQHFDATVIQPAKQWHIDKYSKQPKILFRETPELYDAITKPYIASHPATDIGWLHQILKKEKEVERILFEDTDSEVGFMFNAFAPAEKVREDIKNDPETFQALVLVNRSDLTSIRSLEPAHLPLLRNIQTKVCAYATTNLGISSSHLRLFFHYKPTYFHLHVHVVHVGHEMYINEKDYRLEDVIQNIELMGNYYQRATLPYTLGTNDELFVLYQKHLAGLSK